jgi:hypothetical protein
LKEEEEKEEEETGETGDDKQFLLGYRKKEYN